MHVTEPVPVMLSKKGMRLCCRTKTPCPVDQISARVLGLSHAIGLDQACTHNDNHLPSFVSLVPITY